MANWVVSVVSTALSLRRGKFALPFDGNFGAGYLRSLCIKEQEFQCIMDLALLAQCIFLAKPNMLQGQLDHNGPFRIRNSIRGLSHLRNNVRRSAVCIKWLVK